jgi:hypothetical protein
LRSKRTVGVLILLLTSLAVSFAQVPQAEISKLTAILPGAQPLGWTSREAPSFYSTDLYRLIDGGADAYLQYGLVAMTHAEYKSKNLEITAEIYDMGDALHAFGIYSAERSPDYHFIPIGAEGYAEEGCLNFFQGVYYIKLQAFGDGSAPFLQAAASHISAKIGSATKMPEAITWLPAKGLVNHSQKYVVQAPMGHDFLSPAVTALYRLDGSEPTVLATIAASPADAARRMASLRAYYQKTGRIAPFSGLPLEAWATSNQYDGDVVFLVRGHHLLVVQHPPAHPETFLTDLISSLKD